MHFQYGIILCTMYKLEVRAVVCLSGAAPVIDHRNATRRRRRAPNICATFRTVRADCVQFAPRSYLWSLIKYNNVTGGARRLSVVVSRLVSRSPGRSILYFSYTKLLPAHIRGVICYIII